MAESTSHYRDKEREAGQSYLTKGIVSISYISRDNLSWNKPCNKDNYELIVTSNDKRKIYEIEALDLMDTLRRKRLDQLAERIVREFS
jgi:hypothetical protein